MTREQSWPRSIDAHVAPAADLLLLVRPSRAHAAARRDQLYNRGTADEQENWRSHSPSEDPPTAAPPQEPDSERVGARWFCSNQNRVAYPPTRSRQLSTRSAGAWQTCFVATNRALLVPKAMPLLAAMRIG